MFRHLTWSKDYYFESPDKEHDSLAFQLPMESVPLSQCTCKQSVITNQDTQARTAPSFPVCVFTVCKCACASPWMSQYEGLGVSPSVAWVSPLNTLKELAHCWGFWRSRRHVLHLWGRFTWGRRSHYQSMLAASMSGSVNTCNCLFDYMVVNRKS